MKALAPEFAKACVDIVNATAELLESTRQIPCKIVVKKERMEEVQP